MRTIQVLALLCTFGLSWSSVPLDEQDDLFEGDINIPELVAASKHYSEMLNVMAARKNNQWPNAIMPYVISFTAQAGLKVIKSAMKEWMEVTCIRLIPRTTEKNYVEFITGGGGCWSNGIGSRQSPGKQKINLDKGCWYHGIVVHEIGHALGFWHEQSRPDRDSFITIQWDNIKKGLDSQFRKYPHSIVDSLGVPYDYDSIMHYGKKAFSKNGEDTIVPKKSGVKIGQRYGLSKLDVLQANRMYKCRSTSLPPTQPPTGLVTEGYIMHLQSKKCLSPVGGRVLGENQPVVASRKCNQTTNVFTIYGNGTIQHDESGMCLHPTGDCNHPQDNTEIVLSKDCGDPKQNFFLSDDGLLKHSHSKTCVRPVYGVKNVRDNTRMVIHSECDVDKFAFSFSALPPDAENLAFGQKTAQSTTYYDAVSNRAVDGKRNGNYREKSCSHTWKSEQSWWSVDLGKQVNVGSVFVSNRADCCWERISGFEVHVGNRFMNHENNARCGGRHNLKRGETKKILCDPPRKGRYVNIVINNSVRTSLTLCEVEVYSAKMSRPKPDIHGVIQHSKSKLCIIPKYENPRNNSVVVLSASCSVPYALFRSLSDGSLQHVATGMCLSPKGGCERSSDDTELVLIDHCRRKETVFSFTEEGSLMHFLSKSCAMASSYPVATRGTTMVVLNSVCDPTKHSFKMVTAPIRPPTSLPPSGNCGRVMLSAMVIGGVDAKPGAWPWQIALKRHGRFSCGGSLIKPNWVLTAAHCISTSLSADKYTVVLGEHDRRKQENAEVTIKVKKYYIHPNYDRPYPINNDVALLQLVRPVKLNSRINIVCLPPQDYELPSTSVCYITGWGKIRHPGSSHPILQEAKLPPVSNAVCQQKLKKSPGASILTITSNMLCAGKRGTKLSGCHGDSGGPYVCKDRSGHWFLQGSVSWGSPRCIAEERYTVFARIAKFRKWIDEHINKSEA